MLKLNIKNFTKDGLWLFLRQVITFFSSFFLTYILATLLPYESFGTYKYVLAMVGMFSLFTLTGIDVAVVNAVARGFEGSYLKALKSKMKWGVLGGATSISLSIYYYFNNNYELFYSFLIVAPFIPFIETLNLYHYFLQGRKLFKYSSVFTAVSHIIVAIIVTVTVFFTINVLLVLLSYIISWTLIGFLSYKIIAMRFPANEKEDTITIHYGKHLSLTALPQTIYIHADRALIFLFLGPLQLAIYSIASIIQQFIDRFSFGIIHELSLPNLSRRTIADIDKVIYRNLAGLAVFGALISYGYVLVSPFLFNLAFPNYPDSVYLTQLLVFLSIIILPNMYINSAIRSKLTKLPARILYRQNAAYLISLGVLVFILPIYGITGAVLLRIMTAGATLIIGLFSWREIRNNFV